MITGVLLAGGASTRMGSAKALARDGRSTFMTRGVRTLWTACSSVVAVLGKGADRIQNAVEQEFTELAESGALQVELSAAHQRGTAGFELRFCRNPRWTSGMLSSVRLGLRDALAQRPRGVLVLPVDHPSVAPRTIAGLAEVLNAALASCRGDAERRAFRYAVVPRHRRRRGHPVAMSAGLARAILTDADAHDLSDAVRRNARLVGYLDVSDPGVVRNVNRPSD